jgi:hypothetical protein
MGNPYCSDDVENAGDGTAIGADLGKSIARLSHDGVDLGGIVAASTSGLAESIGLNLGGAEDGRVDLSHRILALAGDDAALDAEGGTVATSITSLGHRVSPSLNNKSSQAENIPRWQPCREQQREEWLLPEQPRRK